MKALVDGDIVAYRCAASADTEEDVSVALIRTDALMKEILEAVGADTYTVFLSGAKELNFRYNVDPMYKANRVSTVKPIYLESCKEFLVTNWEAVRCHGYEADDGMGVAQDANSVICSIDKDMLQVSGLHYNFVKKVFTNVLPEEGLKSFYIQTLVGDTSDNVMGVKGIGPVKAHKLLDPLLPEEYYEACKALYDSEERFHNNCKLLYIWREFNDIWKPPGVYSGRKAHQLEGSDLSHRSKGVSNGTDSLCNEVSEASSNLFGTDPKEHSQ